jgi:hypothetical protein
MEIGLPAKNRSSWIKYIPENMFDEDAEVMTKELEDR